MKSFFISSVCISSKRRVIIQNRRIKAYHKAHANLQQGPDGEAVVVKLLIKISISRTSLTSWFDCTHWCSWFRILSGRKKWSKFKIPGKSSFGQIKIRMQNFCYIQVIVFYLGYLPLASVETQQLRDHEKNVKNIKKSGTISF